MSPRHTSIVTFFGATFLLAWALWIAVAAATSSASSSAAMRGMLFLPGTFAPGIVAVWLTARAEGRDGLRTLLHPLLASRVPAQWYVFAIGYLAAAKLATAVVYRAIAGSWPAFGDELWLLLPVAIAFSTLFQAGEEIGWRGYALPRLTARIGLGPASILLGVIWACWHLPLFYIPGTDSTGQPFLPYLLSVTALSVAMAWLYARTNGSLLLVMIMHAAINNTAGIVSSALPGATNPLALNAPVMAWITTGVLWAGAVYFLVRMRTTTQMATAPSRRPIPL